MAPWLRVDKQMLDIEGVDSVTLFEGTQCDTGERWNVNPKIWFQFKDGRNRNVTFDTMEEARSMYESLFQVLMPEALEALAAQEQQNET